VFTVRHTGTYCLQGITAILVLRITHMQALLNPLTALQVRVSSIHITCPHSTKSLSLSPHYNLQSVSSSAFLPRECTLCHKSPLLASRLFIPTFHHRSESFFAPAFSLQNVTTEQDKSLTASAVMRASFYYLFCKRDDISAQFPAGCLQMERHPRPLLTSRF
jgi:hypothetical protein